MRKEDEYLIAGVDWKLLVTSAGRKIEVGDFK